jgi:2,5-diketo-D-gluconate reductase B
MPGRMDGDTATTAAVVEVRGVQVPALGFGTWKITGPAATESVADALEIGYRHIDTARVYRNEREVGRGIAESDVPREEIWLTTKVPYQDAAPDRFRACAEASLRDLGTDYVDLLLLHWPNPDVPIGRTLEAMRALQEEGRIRHFGLSNAPAGVLREAVGLAPVLCNQIEYHPLLAQSRLLELAREADVLITAYSPLAHRRVLEDETLRRIAERHGRTAGQVALRWLLDQPHVSPIPKASSHERRLENWQALELALTDEDRAAIDALPKDVRTMDPPWAPEWDA